MIRKVVGLVLVLVLSVMAREIIVDRRHHPPPGPVLFLGISRRVELKNDFTFVCEKFGTLKAHEEESDGRIYAIDGCHTLDRIDYQRADLLVNTYAYALVHFTLRDGRRQDYWLPRKCLQ